MLLKDLKPGIAYRIEEDGDLFSFLVLKNGRLNESKVANRYSLGYLALTGSDKGKIASVTYYTNSYGFIKEIEVKAEKQ